MKIQVPISGVNYWVELDELQWKTQAGSFASGTARNAKGGTQRVFLKRYSGQNLANGHMLLTNSIHQPVACTPAFYGYFEVGGFRYYISQFLEGTSTFEMLTSNTRLPHNKLLTHRRITTLISNLRAALEEINQRGFFHPDVCYKNILIDPEPQGDRIFLIDLDACIPLHSSRLVTGITADQTWWLLHHERKLGDYRFLNPAMLLTLALVLFYGMSEASHHNSSGIVNVKKILDGRPDTQRHLLGILDRQDASLLGKTYHQPVTGNNARRVLDAWQGAAQTLQSANGPDWRKISMFLSTLALFCRPL